MVANPSPFGVDEELWFGDSEDDQEAESRASESVAAVGARIIGAKPFPIAAKKLEELTRNPKARLEQVVSVLESDPGLSARLLRLVNSAGYGLKVRVTSVRHAAVLVGTRRLHQVATTAAILDLFEADNARALQLLEHAAVVGSLCRYLAVHLGLPHDELFTCGFLHDIGKLMLLDAEGDRYAALLDQHAGGPDQIHRHERQAFGFDHAVLGAHVLAAWNIPDPVPKVVAWHHQPARALQDSLVSAMVQALRLADLLSYTLTQGDIGNGIALVASGEAARYLDISEPQLAAMWNDLCGLADRSRARSHGEPDLEVVAPRRLDVPHSLRPRHSARPGRSLRPATSGAHPLLSPATAEPERGPSGAGAPRSIPVQETPQHFPCVTCNKPSYGHRCRACGGQACPDHLLGWEQWCSLCVREYARYRAKKGVPRPLRIGALAFAGFSVGASLTSALAAGRSSASLVGPLSMLLLWAVLLPVGWRLWLRVRFIRSRPKGRVPQPVRLPKPDPVFISSLDANLESDGLLGRSMPPTRPVSRAPDQPAQPSATVAAASPSPPSSSGRQVAEPAQGAPAPAVDPDPSPSEPMPVVRRLSLRSELPSYDGPSAQLSVEVGRGVLELERLTREVRQRSVPAAAPAAAILREPELPAERRLKVEPAHLVERGMSVAPAPSTAPALSGERTSPAEPDALAQPAPHAVEPPAAAPEAVPGPAEAQDASSVVVMRAGQFQQCQAATVFQCATRAAEQCSALDLTSERVARADSKFPGRA